MTEEQIEQKTVIHTQQTKPNNEGLKQQYIDRMNHEPLSPYDDFKNIQSRIRVGRELLPDGNKELYEKTVVKLNTENPNFRDTTFDYEDLGDVQLPVYKIKTDDAGNGKSEPIALKHVLDDIKDQQWEYHSAKLLEIDGEILNVLKNSGIIKIDDKSFDKMVDNFIKNEMKDMEG